MLGECFPLATNREQKPLQVQLEQQIDEWDEQKRIRFALAFGLISYRWHFKNNFIAKLILRCKACCRLSAFTKDTRAAGS